MCVHQPRALRIRSVYAAEFHATAKSMQQFLDVNGAALMEIK